MIFTELVSMYIAEAPTIALRNTEKFLKQCAIDRYDLEDFVFRSFKGNRSAFYVSTIPSGLAGSTSDIDIILISDFDNDQDATLTSIAFHKGRRVGVKPVHHMILEEAFETIKRVVNFPIAERLEAIDTQADRLSMRLTDIERLINGVSFTVGTPYLQNLPALCNWMLPVHLRNYREHILMAALANRAGAVRATYGYTVNATVAAMDVLMAACGRINTNSKWTFERWSQFGPKMADSPIANGVAILDAINVAVREQGKYSFYKNLCEFSRVNEYFDEAFTPCVIAEKAFIDINDSVQNHEFLESVVSLSGPKRTAVIASATLDAITKIDIDDIATLDPYLAQVALSLLQLNLLSLAKFTFLDQDNGGPSCKINITKR